MRNHEDTLELRKRFQPGKHIVIIGGGFIGLELASSAAKRGCHVTLVEAQPRILMRGVPQPIAEIIHKRHEAAGVVMLVDTALASLSANAVHLKDGRVLPADTIIAGIGAAPKPSLPPMQASSSTMASPATSTCKPPTQTFMPQVIAPRFCTSSLATAASASKPGGQHKSRRQRRQKTCWVATGNNTVPWFWSDQYDLGLQITGMADMGPVTVDAPIGT